MRTSSTDLAGKSFNRWKVVEYLRKEGPHHYYSCRCACGAVAEVQANSLKAGTSRSCGCHRVEVSRAKATTHGGSYHPAYQSWIAMRRRCGDTSYDGYAEYGGRGIRVCERWQNFAFFWEDMGGNWGPDLSIDRIDVNGDYEPSNCRWATATEQANNKRNNAIITTPWGYLTKAEAARRAGITYATLKHRLRRNWPTSRLFAPQRIRA